MSHQSRLRTRKSASCGDIGQNLGEASALAAAASWLGVGVVLLVGPTVLAFVDEVDQFAVGLALVFPALVLLWVSAKWAIAGLPHLRRSLAPRGEGRRSEFALYRLLCLALGVGLAAAIAWVANQPPDPPPQWVSRWGPSIDYPISNEVRGALFMVGAVALAMGVGQLPAALLQRARVRPAMQLGLFIGASWAPIVAISASESNLPHKVLIQCVVGPAVVVAFSMVLAAGLAYRWIQLRDEEDEEDSMEACAGR